MIAGTIIMIAAAVVTGVIFSIITKTMHSVDRELTMEFDKHYAFIAEDSESDFWKEVFEAASAQSKDYNAYLEDIGTELGRDYSTEDLLRIAVNSHMDGIVYSGGTNDRVRKLIDRASDSGIGVVVLQNDVETSRRQCYVGNIYLCAVLIVFRYRDGISGRFQSAFIIIFDNEIIRCGLVRIR